MTRITPPACTLFIAVALAACDDPPVDDGGDGSGADAALPAADAGPPGADAGGAWRDEPAVAGGPIQETAVVALDGKIWVLGGFDDQGAMLDDVRIYDPAAMTWSTGPDLPAACHHANAAVHDGTIYVLGSLRSSFAASGDSWALTPGVDTEWRTLASMPAGSERGSSAVGVVGNQILLAGGLKGFGAVAVVSAYDVMNNTWDDSPADLPAVRDHGCGAVVDGRFFVIGGRAGAIDAVTGGVLERVGDAWTARAAMPTARGGIGCAVVGGAVIVVGGEGNDAAASRVFPQVERYDVAGDAWTSLADMPTPRHGMGIAAVDGRVYVPGGATVQGFGAVDVHESLLPP